MTFLIDEKGKIKKSSARLSPKSMRRRCSRLSASDSASANAKAAALSSLRLTISFAERFLPFADGLRPGIRTPTELNDGFSSARAFAV